MRPDFCRGCVNDDAIGDDCQSFRVINRFAERDQREERKDRQVELRMIRPEPNPSKQHAAQDEDVEHRRNDHDTNNAFPQNDEGGAQADEGKPERVEKTPAKGAVESTPKPRGEEPDKEREKKETGPEDESADVLLNVSANEPIDDGKQKSADAICDECPEENLPTRIARWQWRRRFQH